MGDRLRDELKKQRRASSRGYRSDPAAKARSEAIKREQGRQALRARAKEKAIQGELI